MNHTADERYTIEELISVCNDWKEIKIEDFHSDNREELVFRNLVKKIVENKIEKEEELESFISKELESYPDLDQKEPEFEKRLNFLKLQALYFHDIKDFEFPNIL